MSMMMCNAWLKDPISGWEQVKVDTEKVYSNLYEVMDDFSKTRDFDILKSWSKAVIGGVSVYHLTMKTKYQKSHPEYNQAEWEAELTVITE